MKFNTLLKKSALAVAIATVSFGASAGSLTIATPTVLANEIFGAGSETTSVRLPSAVFASTTATGLAAAALDGTTIKLTLGGAATFAENYQDPVAWAAQGITVTAGAGDTLVAPADIFDITGGTANDNQITITLQPNASLVTAALKTANATNIKLEGFKVKNLKSALERKGAGKLEVSTATVEVRQGTLFENTPAAVAFASINGVALAAAPTGYTTTVPGRNRIQVDAEQKKFTLATGTGAANDFDGANAVNILTLGDVVVKRGVVGANTLGVPAAADAKKESGAPFDFTGGDTVSLTLSSDAPYANYGKVYVAPTCTAVPTGVIADFSVTDPAVTTKQVAVPTSDIDLSGLTTWKLCAVVDGTKRIPEANFDLGLKATYYSARYTESVGAEDYGKVLRNGCQVTLFNLPNVNAADDAFIRFTNTSLKAGEVNAYVWDESGNQLDLGAKVIDSLDKHATVVLHTNAAQQGTGVYLGDVLPEFAASTGRSRIVLEGAFASCEALGLVRGANGGPLTNMTSTVYSGGPNNTSNTSN